jgi:hypothetical protein
MRHLFSRYIIILGIFLLLCPYIKSQEIGSRYQGGIVVGPGIIMHPTLLFTRGYEGVARYKFNIDQANNSCKSISTGGYRDWRVPTIIDLEYINRYAQDFRNEGGYYPNPISPGNVYISNSIKTDNDWFSKNSYRYFYYMISDITARKTGFLQKELQSLDAVGYLLPVRYIR